MKETIRVSFLSNDEIRQKVEGFRKTYWNNSVPVEIEDIIDLKLKINIIPIPGLQDLCDTITLITSGWDSIYVDNKIFSDERYLNRLRFSFAHEVGHYILHKHIYETLNIKNIENFYKFFEIITPEQYGYLEAQANKFANFLLVPRDMLAKEKEKIMKSTKNLFDINSIDKNTLNSYISRPLSNIFGVSDTTIEIALNQN